MEVNPLTKSKLGWSKEYKKVPVAVFQDGEVVNDSAQIMDAVLARSNGGGDANASFAGPEAMRLTSVFTEVADSVLEKSAAAGGSADTREKTQKQADALQRTQARHVRTAMIYMYECDLIACSSTLSETK